jgi:hypothetical protein
LNAVEKDLVVYQVFPITEVATGNIIYQVLFGEYVDVTPDILDRMDMMPGQPIPRRVPVMWLALNMKDDTVPYRVGSKWRATMDEQGNINLASVSEKK